MRENGLQDTRSRQEFLFLRQPQHDLVAPGLDIFAHLAELLRGNTLTTSDRTCTLSFVSLKQYGVEHADINLIVLYRPLKATTTAAEELAAGDTTARVANVSRPSR